MDEVGFKVYDIVKVGLDLFSTGIFPDAYDELQKIFNDDKHRSKDLAVESFCKAECYPMFKLPRAINGRNDRSKLLFGRVVKSVEKVVYAHPAFIKNIPVNDRPAYIVNIMNGSEEIMTNDFTSYESSFNQKLCLSIEYLLYVQMVGQRYADFICNSLYSTNVCKFAHFMISSVAKRMSGDMNTSLGNGITNLMACKFLVHSKGYTLSKIIVEGDDSLFQLPSGCPRLTSIDFATLGLNAKPVVFDDVGEASFCGNIFDLSSLHNLVDPGKVLRRSGFVSEKYVFSKRSKKLGLLRAQGFSMVYQYGACPIVASFGKAILRVTRGHYADFSEFNSYKFSPFDKIVTSEIKALEHCKTPTFGSRSLVQKLFSFSVSDQLAIEAMFDAMVTPNQFSVPSLYLNSLADNLAYSSDYAVDELVFDDVTQRRVMRCDFVDIVACIDRRLKHNNKLVKESGKSLNELRLDVHCALVQPTIFDIWFGMRKHLGFKPQDMSKEGFSTEIQQALAAAVLPIRLSFRCSCNSLKSIDRDWL